MKKMLRETQTLRAGCSKVEPKISPRRIPPSLGIIGFADQPPSASPLPWTVPTGAENAFIYLTVSAGPSDFLFLGADYK